MFLNLTVFAVSAVLVGVALIVHGFLTLSTANEIVVTNYRRKKRRIGITEIVLGIVLIFYGMFGLFLNLAMKRVSEPADVRVLPTDTTSIHDSLRVASPIVVTPPTP